MASQNKDHGRGTSQLLDRSEGRIAFEVVGDGPLVVCVPGMGELRTSYRFVAPALASEGFKVASMDLRGYGGSDASFRSYDDVAAASDVEALVSHLGGPAVILGNSMGAGVAVIAGAERPELVAGLALIGPFVRDAPTNLLAKLAWQWLTSGPWARAAWASYLPKLYPGRQPADFTEHRAEIVASMRRPGHTKAFTKTTRTSHRPAEARLDDVRAPALVVMGEKDPDFRDPAGEARWIASRLQAEVVLVPGAGHYPQAEYPEVVNPALIAFAKRCLQ